MLEHKFDPNSSAALRVEVFVGTGSIMHANHTRSPTSPRSLYPRRAERHPLQRRQAQVGVTPDQARPDVQPPPRLIGRFEGLVWSCSLRRAFGDTESLPTQTPECLKSGSRCKVRFWPNFRG